MEVKSMDQAEQLRNVIKLNPAPRPLARIITVTSGKGGVGKSNTSINLACQFKKLGQRVLILVWQTSKLCSGLCRNTISAT